jgi:hypothetical protein
MSVQQNIAVLMTNQVSTELSVKECHVTDYRRFDVSQVQADPGAAAMFAAASSAKPIGYAEMSWVRRSDADYGILFTPVVMFSPMRRSRKCQHSRNVL